MLVEEDVATLREYVDWTFFFHAWELKGRYPAILDDPEKGEVARDLFAGANELLDEIARDGSLQARGVYGFWPARAEGDDVVLDGGVRFPMLRQQADHADSRPNRSLADFVAPVETGLVDHVGAFAVAIHGSEALADRFAAELDDYRAIMVRALADRLAEAFAERLHERRAPRVVRARARRSTSEELIGERFRGIRPAFGYPACPDHSEKRTLLALLDAERAGIELTESCATTPGRERERPLLRPSAGAVLLRRAASGATRSRTTPQRKGVDDRRGRALAPPEPRVRAVDRAGSARSKHGACRAVPNISAHVLLGHGRERP